MPTSHAISVNLGAGLNGLSLCAQLIRTDGTAITSLLTDGFYEVGSGYYIWDYSNFPENFRGGVKFYDQDDTSTVLSFVDLDLGGASSDDCNDICIGEMGDTFDITYSDQPNLNIYALLFSASDLSKAWNPSAGDFQSYTLASQSSFVLPLEEDSNRLGWYTYTISDVSNIPAVTGSQFYFIEVWQQSGSSANRSADCIMGNLRVCWGKQSSEWMEIAKHVWEYGTRTLTTSAITPQEIWEYASRTLTEGGAADCDFTELQQTILLAIAASTGKTLTELAAVDKHLGDSIQETFDLLEACCASRVKTTPTVKKPVLGPLTKQEPPEKPNMRFL